MAQYLADLLAGYPGFRGTAQPRNWLGDEEEPIPGRAEVTGLGGTGSVGPRDLLSPASPMRMLEAPEGMGGEEMQRRAASYAMTRAPTPGGPMPPLNGRQDVVPHPTGPDVPMAGGPGVPPPMGRPQAGAMTPAGVQRPDFLSRAGAAAGDLLGGAKKWLGGEAFPANQPMSRGMVLAQMLGQFGAGLSQTGRVGPGLEAANQVIPTLRQGERKFRQDEQENRYKTMTAEAQLARAMKPAAGSSSEFERGLEAMVASGQMTQEDALKLWQQRMTAQATEGTAARTFEGALLDPNTPPEIRARAEAGIAAKNEPTARDKAYIDHLNRTGRHQEAMEEIARIRAERPAGDRTVGTSEYERLRERLPLDQRVEADRKRLQALTSKGESAPFSAGELSGARKDYRSIQKARSDIERYAELFEKHGNQVLPGEAKGQMEAAYGAGLSALAAANNTGVIQPGELPMLQKQLLGPGGFGAEAGELLGVDVAGQVRGQAATMLDRLRKAEEELVSTYGADTLTGAGRREVEPTGPQPGDVEDGYRFKGGNPANPDNWEPVE